MTDFFLECRTKLFVVKFTVYDFLHTSYILIFERDCLRIYLVIPFQSLNQGKRYQHLKCSLWKKKKTVKAIHYFPLKCFSILFTFGTLYKISFNVRNHLRLLMYSHVFSRSYINSWPFFKFFFSFLFNFLFFLLFVFFVSFPLMWQIIQD